MRQAGKSADRMKVLRQDSCRRTEAFQLPLGGDKDSCGTRETVAPGALISWLIHSGGVVITRYASFGERYFRERQETFALIAQPS